MQMEGMCSSWEEKQSGGLGVFHTFLSHPLEEAVASLGALLCALVCQMFSSLSDHIFQLFLCGLGQRKIS